MVSRYHIAADEQAAYTVVHDSKIENFTSEVLVFIMNLLITTDLLLADDYTSFTILTCGARTVHSSGAFEFTPIS